MSAYITQLDILGFDGGAAAWTSKVNTVEEGGGGGGAMSAACFTLSDTAWWENEVDWYRVEATTFVDNTIRLDYGRRAFNEVWDIEDHSVTLTVTSEYEGLFPDSITFRLVGECSGKGDDNGIYLYTPLQTAFIVYDNETSIDAWTDEREEISPYDPYDSGEVTRLLTYPEGSSGLHHIYIQYATSGGI